MKISGKTLRRWMRQGGLTYDDVGKALDVDPVTVRNWEKNGLSRVAAYAFRFRFRKADFSARAPWWVRGRHYPRDMEPSNPA